MNTSNNNPSPSKNGKYCSGCGLEKPAIKGEYFGANRSTGDGLARRCLECARAADRRRQPQHQARKLLRQRRQRKEERAREAAEYVAGRRSPSTATPHAAEDIEGFWNKYDRKRFLGLLITHFKNCKSSNNIEVVQKAIDATMKITVEHWQAGKYRPLSLEELSLLTEDELAKRLRRLMQGSPLYTGTCASAASEDTVR